MLSERSSPLSACRKIGTSAVQSRATGGVAGGTYLFALPGSPGACKDAWDEILAYISSIIATAPVTSWKSCPGWMNINAGNEPPHA